MNKKFNLIVSLIILLALAGCFGNTNVKSNSNKSRSNNSEDVSKLNSIKAKDIKSFSQAPELKKEVNDGKLPDVNKRLPDKKDIMVEPVYSSIGRYGGDIKTPWQGTDQKWDPEMMSEEPLFRFNDKGDDVEPNVAKGYDVNKDSTEFTIHLRKGMKWSDGKPFTADDILFYWKHMMKPETFGKSIYECYYSRDPKTGKKHLAKVTKVDDETVKVKFKDPNPNFLKRLAIDNKWFYAPAHYEKKILPEFVGKDKAAKIAKKMGYSNTKTLLKQTGYYYWMNKDIPTLRPWVASNDPHSEEFVLKRNPYFWKVDAKGNQLPYINNLRYEKDQDKSQDLLGILGGDYNFASFDEIKNITTLKENEKKGGFHTITWKGTGWSSTMIELNQTTENKNLRKLVQDKRFRHALSIAIDREKVSDIVTNGIAKPAQAAPPKDLFGYQKGWKDKWTDYDPKKAGKLLDELGISKKNKNGFRLYDDGSVVTLTISTYNQKEFKDFLELIKNGYEKIGIRVNLDYVDEGAYEDKQYNNKLDATPQSLGLIDVALRPETLVPVRVIQPWYGNYGLYYSSNGKKGTKPKGDIAKILDYWGKIQSSTTKQEIKKWSDKIYKLHMKNMWVIGYTEATPKIYAISNNLENVPKHKIPADEFRFIGFGHPEQFYFSK